MLSDVCYTWRYLGRGILMVLHTYKHMQISMTYTKQHTKGHGNTSFSWSRLLRSLMHGSAVARWVGFWVRTPSEVCMSLVSAVCYQAEVTASDWSLVQRSPIYCEVSECDYITSIMWRHWPVRSVAPWGGEEDTVWAQTVRLPNIKFRSYTLSNTTRWRFIHFNT
jgi:hypothetical protein